MPNALSIKAKLDALCLKVKTMLLTEYDEKYTMELFRKEAREEAQDKVCALISKLLSLGRLDDIARATSDHAARDRLYEEFGLT